MPTYRLVTLGCKVSRADAASIERALGRAGLTRAPRGESAALCVVAGCAVTAAAEGKSRRAIRRLARENPHATVVAAGCIGMREESSREAGAELLVAPDEVGRFTARLREVSRWSDLRVSLTSELAPPSSAEAAEGLAGRSLGEGGPGPSGFPGRTRAFLKVQDGCDGACAYCMVPKLRGRSRSAPVSEVVDEAKRLVDAGHAEIVLAGVRLGAYSHGGVNLAGLVEKLVGKLVGLEPRALERLRLSSIEPMDLSGENESLAELAASSAVLCPHFHLPLQSGDDDILARMNRPYRLAEFRGLVERLRSRVEDPAITTDVIAGFPGETAAAHARSVKVVEEISFARVHAFPFSPRPGTAAAEIPHEPGMEVARRRTAELIEAGRRASREFRRLFIAGTANVLAEPGGGPGRLAGYTERYVRVVFDGPEELVGGLVRVRCLAEADGQLVGELEP